MKEPVDHILRPSLPWRSPVELGVTECGYDAAKVKTLTRDEFFQRFKDLGEQRTALLTCMTCSQTARRWQTWEQEPREAMQREIEWEGVRWPREKRGKRLRDELVAIAALIAAHPEEYATLVSETQQRREWVEKKKTVEQKPQRRTTWRPL